MANTVDETNTLDPCLDTRPVLMHCPVPIHCARAYTRDFRHVRFGEEAKMADAILKKTVQNLENFL